jgi:hypothetical protein
LSPPPQESGGSVILFGVHAWDCTWGAYPEQQWGGGGGYADALEGGAGLGGYESALGAGAGGGDVGGGEGGASTPLARCALSPCNGGGGGGGGSLSCACGGGSPAAVRGGGGAGGYGGALASSSSSLSMASQPPPAAAGAPAAAWPATASLAAGDIFGVAHLAQRVLRRLVGAGLLVVARGG